MQRKEKSKVEWKKQVEKEPGKRFRKGFRALVKSTREYFPVLVLSEAVKKRVKEVLSREKPQKEVEEILSLLSAVKEIKTYAEEDEIDRIVKALFDKGSTAARKRAAKSFPTECAEIAAALVGQGVFRWNKSALHLLIQTTRYIEDVSVIIEMLIDMEKIDRKRLFVEAAEEEKLLEQIRTAIGIRCSDELLCRRLLQIERSSTHGIKAICKIIACSAGAYKIIREIKGIIENITEGLVDKTGENAIREIVKEEAAKEAEKKGRANKRKEEIFLLYLIAVHESIKRDSLYSIEAQEVLKEVFCNLKLLMQSQELSMHTLYLLESIVKRKDCPAWIHRDIFRYLSNNCAQTNRIEVYRLISRCIFCLPKAKKKRWARKVVLYAKKVLTRICTVENEKKRERLLSNTVFLLANTVAKDNVYLIEDHLSYLLKHRCSNGKARIIKIVEKTCVEKSVFSLFLDILEEEEPVEEILDGLISANICIEDAQISSRILNILRSFLLKKKERAIKRIEPIISLLSSEKQGSFSAILVDLSLRLIEKDSAPDYLYLFIKDMALHCPSSTLEKSFIFLLEETRSSSSPLLFSALISVAGRWENITSELCNKCILSLQSWISSAPSQTLSAVYRFALFLCTKNPSLSIWRRISHSIIERLPLYAKDKKEMESSVLGRISRYGHYDNILTLLSKYAPWTKKHLNLSWNSVVQHLPFEHLPETVSFLLSFFAKEAPLSQVFSILSISSLIDYASLHSFSCRETVGLLFPILSAISRSDYTPLRKAFCTLARSIVLSCWGLSSDYPMVIHLFNLIFPLIIDSKLSPQVLSLLPLFSERLSVTFISSYLSHGLTHRCEAIREIHKKAYLLIRDLSNESFSYSHAGMLLLLAK